MAFEMELLNSAFSQKGSVKWSLCLSYTHFLFVEATFITVATSDNKINFCVSYTIFYYKYKTYLHRVMQNNRYNYNNLIHLTVA